MNTIEQANYKNQEGLSLADRQKQIENVTRTYLMPKIPVIVRIDGKAFHSYTKQKNFTKPFDENIMKVFEKTTKTICENIQNVEFGYHQSDEVSLFLKDYKDAKQQQYFNGNIQKMVSTIASEFTYYFNKNMNELIHWNWNKHKPAIFDCRCFNVPTHEVTNYFIWRQRDAIRNSITSYALSHFSIKELHEKTSTDKLEMLKLKGFDWESDHIKIQRGTAFYQTEIEETLKNLSPEILQYLKKQNKDLSDTIIRKRWVVDYNIPIFSESKSFIEKLVEVETETA